MENYNPPFTITNEMLSHISSISEKIGRIVPTRNLDNKPHLRRNNKIRSIHSTLKIEANSFSLSQVRDVINGKIILGSQKEIQEVKNAYEAYEDISNIDPYSIEELLKYHGIMTKYLEEESGKFRKGGEGVFDKDVCIFIAPPAQFVSELINDLFSWINKEKQNIHPLLLSAIFHYEFVFIHPFTDDNGRMARLWHTVLLSKWKPIFEFIPLESQIEKFQNEYYDAIAKSHANGNSNAFIEFILKMIDEILDEISIQIEEDFNHTSLFVRELLNVMEYDIGYTANEILTKLNLKSKETLRKNYINPAIELGLIEMSIPDKPNSRNQKYIKV